MSEPRAADYKDRRAGLQGDPTRPNRTSRRRVLVAGVLIAAVLLLLIIFGPVLLGPVLQPGSASSRVPIGAVLGFGPVTLSVCPSESVFSSDGCVAGHYVYRVTITIAAVALGDFGLVVTNSSAVIWSGDSNAGLTILNANDSVLAQFSTLGGPMYADSNWTYTNMTSGSTQLSTSDALLLDMGRMNPGGLGLTLSAFPTDGSGYTGTTTPTPLD
jgi:hypothetical protein